MTRNALRHAVLPSQAEAGKAALQPFDIVPSRAAVPQGQGNVVARHLGLGDAPVLVTNWPRKAQVAVTWLTCPQGEPRMTAEIPGEDSFVVTLHLRDGAHYDLWQHSKPRLDRAHPRDALTIAYLGDGLSATLRSSLEVLEFHIPRQVLDDLTTAAGGPRIAMLVCPPGTIDPVLAHLGATLLPAFQRRRTPSLFVDQVVSAIVTHLLCRYGGFDPAAIPRGGLTPLQEERAKAFLTGNYAEEILVNDVARECGLSRGHFIKAFRRTTGLTPYKWLQRYRVEKAKCLLLTPGMPIAEIAVACGFADQSHLTRVFSSLVGTTPAAWRQRRRE